MTLLQTGLDHKVGEIDTYQYGANFSNTEHWNEDHPSTAPVLIHLLILFIYFMLRLMPYMILMMIKLRIVLVGC